MGAHLLTALAEQSRASRLSLPDAVRALASQPTTSPLHISRRVNEVERYLAVHGQVLLGILSRFPNRAVSQAPLLRALRDHMATCRHHKVFARADRAATRKARTANPMTDRLAGQRRPMEATATRLVRGVYQVRLGDWDLNGDRVGKCGGCTR